MAAKVTLVDDQTLPVYKPHQLCYHDREDAHIDRPCKDNGKKSLSHAVWFACIKVVVSATDWMLPELLGISFSANETLVSLFQSTHALYVVHVPSAEVVSVTPLFRIQHSLWKRSG